ncbi:histidine kinase [Paenibacillus sp. LHD-117]|uniref:sensor histidine kinase n=1 Tax=Paenibacillus sp. LHD-117 TaxID=3071412 RepID=UPI0027E1573F|nr:histidine kinase [Paenibacillus sp. LHD-117]MDQ6423596.1 histidine kinase [Paenibacillus sp. LHD-117]
MTKQRILNEFNDNLSLFNKVETFFAYSVSNDDFIVNVLPYEKVQKHTNILRAFFVDSAAKVHLQRWQIFQKDGHSYLVRTVQATQNVYVGALIHVNNLLPPLSLDMKNNYESVLFGMDGTSLTAVPVSMDNISMIRSMFNNRGNNYQVFTNKTNGLNYLLVDKQFQWAPIMLVASIPERELLQKLVYFQKVIFIIPFGGIVILLFYSLFLKQVLLKPMHELIRGMRRITQGDWNVQLKGDKSKEFTFMIDAFNHMVSQIRHLKISVYEEMIKKQEAEFKHLQTQINPHFYLNSLNIIYSLSVLKKNDLVQKMTEHLADYFRFITRSHRESILLSEELGHIRNYLEIQQLRFPEKLTFSILLPDHYESCGVLPLMIQPFVENAIIHGMDKGKKGFHINIIVQADKEDSTYYVVLISDNGKGFPSDKLKQLQSGQSALGIGDQSLGIWNVQNRLRMKFGDKIDIEFSNGTENGAIVRMRIPTQLE